MSSASSPLNGNLCRGRIAFLADYGPRVGLGHLVRCSSLARSLKVRGFDVLSTGVQPPDFLNLDFSHVSCPESVFDWDDWALAFNVQALILDSYVLPDEDRKILRRAFPALIVLDDLRDQWIADVDVVLNPSPLADPLKYLERAPAARALLGPDYTLLGPAFSKAGPAWLQRPLSVLVTFGAADPRRLTAPTCQHLLELLPPEVVLDVVLPTDCPVDLPCTDRLRTHQGLPDLAHLMQSARLAVTQVGGTMGELAFSGVPAVVGVIAKTHAPLLQEHLQFDWCARVDLIDVGFQAPRLLAEAACRAWYDSPALMRQSKRGPQLVDGRGSERVADCIVGLMDRIASRGEMLGRARA